LNVDLQNQKELNSQLKDMLNTMNGESRKIREESERRETELRGKINELSKALILQEKKMVDKVIESIDNKHTYAMTGNAAFGDPTSLLNQFDQELENMKMKRRELEQVMDTPSIIPEPASKTSIQGPPSLSKPAVVQRRVEEKPVQPTPKQAGGQSSVGKQISKQIEEDYMDDFEDI
jgi:hypothetical protein